AVDTACRRDRPARRRDAASAAPDRQGAELGRGKDRSWSWSARRALAQMPAGQTLVGRQLEAQLPGEREVALETSRCTAPGAAVRRIAGDGRLERLDQTSLVQRPSLFGPHQSPLQ